MEKVEAIAERLRQERYRPLWGDCLGKSLRLMRECRRQGVTGAKLVWCILGLATIRLPVIGRMPLFWGTHFWVEVNGMRIETSRPAGQEGFLGVVPSRIRPLITVRFHPGG